MTRRASVIGAGTIGASWAADIPPRGFAARQQFLQIFGSGPRSSTAARPVVSSSLRTEGGRVLRVG
jgi:hypothetical protein